MSLFFWGEFADSSLLSDVLLLFRCFFSFFGFSASLLFPCFFLLFCHFAYVSLLCFRCFSAFLLILRFSFFASLLFPVLLFLFPKCAAKSFTLGVCGLVEPRRCFCVRNRLQPLAAVRNRSHPFASDGNMAVVTFGGFKRRVASFRVAGVAFREITTCFITYRKSSESRFVWQAQYF